MAHNPLKFHLGESEQFDAVAYQLTQRFRCARSFWPDSSSLRNARHYLESNLNYRGEQFAKLALFRDSDFYKPLAKHSAVNVNFNR